MRVGAADHDRHDDDHDHQHAVEPRERLGPRRAGADPPGPKTLGGTPWTCRSCYLYRGRFSRFLAVLAARGTPSVVWRVAPTSGHALPARLSSSASPLIS